MSSPDNPGYADLQEDFYRAYQDLQQTLLDIEPFEDLIRQLQRAIRRTELYEVNAQSGRTPQVDWRGAYSHILVGGQALDRGFTVEGLTVTYMPRGVGARRADTIQQRARFFGYKRPYLGYCRIYLEQEILEAFTRYVRHEEDIRARLREYSDRPLNELRRIFLLPRGLQPTRDSIIDDSIDFTRVRVNERWFYPKAPHDSPLFIESNRRTVEQYLVNCQFVDDEGDQRRSPSQRHEVAREISLRNTYVNLLLNLTFTSLKDSESFTGMLVVIRQWLDEHPDEVCTIYNINRGSSRRRRLNRDGEISFFFQGANQERQGIRRGEIYPGDKMTRGEAGITIQLHNLQIMDSNEQEIAVNVPNIAIWLPQNMAGDVMIQDQGGLEELDSE